MRNAALIDSVNATRKSYCTLRDGRRRVPSALKLGLLGEGTVTLTVGSLVLQVEGWMVGLTTIDLMKQIL